MNDAICSRETELLDAIRRGRWEHHRDEELHAHVSACENCSDLAVAASALHRDMAAAMAEAPVVAAGAAWWRIQRRTRAEAAQRGERMVFFAQVFAVVAAIAIAIAIAGVPHLGSFSLASLSLPSFSLPSFSWTLPLILGITACVALAPVVVYLAVARD